MVSYYKGSLLRKLGRQVEGAAAFQEGEGRCPDYCFPNRLEELAFLQEAVEALPQAPMAHYYLGCLLYDKKRYQEAAAHWEAAVREKPGLAMAWRNLAIYRYNKAQDGPGAQEAMERALSLEPGQARFLLEYDQLAARLGVPAAQRLAALEARPELVAQRDDLALREITLLNRRAAMRRPWQGCWNGASTPGRGARARPAPSTAGRLSTWPGQALEENAPAKAVELLERSLSYPESLGEGKLPNVPDNQAHYYLGVAWQRLGDEAQAEAHFRKAAAGPREPEVVRYYNDQPSDFLYYQGLAHRALGQEDQALGCFHRLAAFGERHLFDKVEVDFFAVSLPEIEMFQEDLGERNARYCNYLRALGALGLGQEEKAAALLGEVSRSTAEQPDLDLSPTPGMV